jgi:hypothetical protein
MERTKPVLVANRFLAPDQRTRRGSFAEGYNGNPEQEPAMSRRKFSSPWLDGPIKATEVAVCSARGARFTLSKSSVGAIMAP